jgi:hypothetical protein
MTAASPPIVVSRVARGTDEDWTGAKSWFGGLPRLGRQAWPRGRTSNKPLVFAAQLDLAEIAAATPNGPLPSEGSLAFFLEEGAVVFVPAGIDQSPTNPPDGTTPAYEPSGELFPQKPSPWARMLFPRWPVEFTALELGAVEPDGPDDTPGDAMRAATNKAVGERFERRQFFFGAKQAFEAMGDAPSWWHSAQCYAEYLQIAAFHAGDVEKARRPYLEKARAEVARLKPKPAFGVFGKKPAAPDGALAKALKELERCEAQDAEYRKQLAGFDAFIAEAKSFASGKDAWTRMNPDETERFKQMFARGREAFRDIVRYRTPHSVDDLVTETLLAMATGDLAAFNAMPPAIRDQINTKYRLPTGAWHQMFGFGVDIQSNAAAENEGNHLLLQLVYDDMVAWRFGDMGAFQFWISPKDLAARNWNGVKLTFECH